MAKAKHQAKMKMARCAAHAPAHAAASNEKIIEHNGIAARRNGGMA
jgi:hypothetical protein